jgi:hypothetical protein
MSQSRNEFINDLASRVYTKLLELNESVTKQMSEAKQTYDSLVDLSKKKKENQASEEEKQAYLEKNQAYLAQIKELETAKKEREDLNKIYISLQQFKEEDLNTLKNIISHQTGGLSSQKAFILQEVIRPLTNKIKADFQELTNKVEAGIFNDSPELPQEIKNENAQWKAVYFTELKTRLDTCTLDLSKETQERSPNSFKINILKREQRILDRLIKDEKEDVSLTTIHKNLKQAITSLNNPDFNVFGSAGMLRKYIQEKYITMEDTFPFLKKDYAFDFKPGSRS